MVVRPGLEEVYKVVPLSTEIFSDIKTPIEVMRILKSVSNHCYMLESIEDNRNWGRYTFLGFNPTLEFTCVNSKITIRGEKNEQILSNEPGKYLREILAEYKSKKYDDLPSFTGGLVGYFSYDFIKYAETSLNLDAKDEEGFKDVDLMLFDKVIAFDNFRQKIIIICNMKLDGDVEVKYHEAAEQIKYMIELIKNHHPAKIKNGRRTQQRK